MKWINRTLISTVIILLIIAVLVLVAVLGFYTTGEKMEVGSWAEWVSAGANIGMFIAAGYAALNVKTWLNEDVYKIQKEIVLINHREIANTFSDSLGILQNFHPDAFYTQQYYSKIDLENFRLKFNVILSKRQALETNVIHINKIGYDFKPHIKIKHTAFINAIPSLIFLHNRYWSYIFQRFDDNTINIGAVEDIYSKLIDLQTELDTAYEEFNQCSTGIMSYFEKKH